MSRSIVGALARSQMRPLPSLPARPISIRRFDLTWCRRAICLALGRTGAAVGAGGATAYYNKDSFGDYVRAAITPGWLSQASRSSGSTSKAPQLDELSRMVQQLSLDVQRRNGAVTIVHGSERGCGAPAQTFNRLAERNQQLRGFAARLVLLTCSLLSNACRHRFFPLGEKLRRTHSQPVYSFSARSPFAQEQRSAVRRSGSRGRRGLLPPGQGLEDRRHAVRHALGPEEEHRPGHRGCAARATRFHLCVLCIAAERRVTCHKLAKPTASSSAY